jgi:hypothetical protein
MTNPIKISQRPTAKIPDAKSLEGTTKGPAG